VCALLLLGASDVAAAADFSFGPPSRVTLERGRAGGVAIGDANGDGRNDIAVVEDITSDARELSLFLQQPDGSLAAPITMALPPDFGWGSPVLFADLDGDGADEILVGMAGLVVARFAGGSLSMTANLPAMYGCAYLASGDIDGDGNMDIVCHSRSGMPTAANIYYGDGAGGFPDTANLLTQVGSYGSAPDFMSLQLADVTGDGRPDLLVTASRVNSFFVYPNDGIGGFLPVGMVYEHPSSPSGAWPAALQVLDLDGDGINEVVTASPDNQPDAKLNVYRRAANGRLVLSERIPTYDSPTALLAADIDGDGDEELVAGHYGFHGVTVAGSGGSMLASQSRFELPGFGNYQVHHGEIGESKALALGDVNGDGCIDLAAATYSGVTLLYGCRPSRTSRPVSDLDGDGVSDLLWQSGGTREFAFWQWADLDAYRQCPLPCPRYKVPPWLLQAVGDFDGDGNSDMFWRNQDTGDNALIRSTLFGLDLTAVTNHDWQVVGAGDFDGDDRSDLLWRNRRTGANAIWKSADYRKQQPVMGVTNPAWQVVGVGDFNGDGRSDILWRNATSGANAIWLSGRYETQRAITAVTNAQWEVKAVGDFNGDGEDDIAWRNAVTGTNGIWLSADYRKQQAVTAVTNTDWTIAAAGDYNGDGRSDLMWRNRRTGANAIWLSARFDRQQEVATLDPIWRLMP